ncbi:MAG: type I restriction endonuclease [Thermodesulfobacteriota bacterium]
MLRDHIKEIREGIKAGLFTNEASVSQGIVLRLLHAFSWPTYDIQIVFPEYPLTGRRADFALCHPAGKPLVFIEVKPLGQSDTGERQLFEYAFHKGVPMAILTNGHEWHFFLPAEQGDYGERRVYKLDLVEREIGEIARRLERYLKYEAICSGAAIESARADYKDVARERLIKAKLPEAWSNLIQEEDGLLLELVADQVESLCGYKPDPDTVATFIRTDVILRGSPIKVPPSKPEPPRPQKPAEPHPPIPAPTQGVGFSLDGV